MDTTRIESLALERQEALTLYEDLTDKLRALLLSAISSGQLSEYKAASLTGVSRSTIRAWLGKQ